MGIAGCMSSSESVGIVGSMRMKRCSNTSNLLCVANCDRYLRECINRPYRIATAAAAKRSQVSQLSLAGFFGLSERFKWRAADLDGAPVLMDRTPRRHKAGVSVKAGTGAALITANSQPNPAAETGRVLQQNPRVERTCRRWAEMSLSDPKPL